MDWVSFFFFFKFIFCETVTIEEAATHNVVNGLYYMKYDYYPKAIIFEKKDGNMIHRIQRRKSKWSIFDVSKGTAKELYACSNRKTRLPSTNSSHWSPISTSPKKKKNKKDKNFKIIFSVSSTYILFLFFTVLISIQKH